MERCGQQTLSGGLRIKMPGATKLGWSWQNSWFSIYSSCDYLESARLEGTWRQSRGSTPRWQLLLRRRMVKDEISVWPLPIGDTDKSCCYSALFKQSSPAFDFVFHSLSTPRSAALFKLGHPLLALEDIAEALAAGYPQDLTYKVKSEILSYRQIFRPV